MADRESGALQHVATSNALSRERRSGLLARARQDVAASDSDQRYRNGVAAYHAGEMERAAAAFQAAAEDGHAESQYLLSLLLEEGNGVARDEAAATSWELRAAEQGHAYAQANVSFRLYSAGDYPAAFQWCRRAAQCALPWAQFHLGLMYRKGEGVAQSDADAAAWYQLAAQGDHTEAQVKLAELYTYGRGVPLSDALAATWYRRAAEQGNAEAQFQLSHLYAIGQGVEHDYVQSREWIRRAAAQGHPQAMEEFKRREYRDA